MQKEENPKGFVRSRLPWIVAAGALLIYLVTVNHWVNLRSVPVISRVTGLDWGLPTQAPVLYAVTTPFRMLPVGWQPLALNIFAAVSAALSLGLLARCVALLPHDRTHEQRMRERSEFSLLSIKLAWVPPVFAALVCALQLTFWEHATSFTADMFDLLLFAYCVRCLLEYRVTHHERWMYKLALVYGLSITNNWAMIGFSPLFLAAVVWIKGIRFFDGKFLVRMTIFGLAGLTFYLLLPILWTVNGGSDAGFFEVLKGNWSAQKAFLTAPELRNRALLLALVAVLPVMLMGVRWPSSFGDTSAAGASLTNLAFRVIHLFFLAAWLWVVFDPKYSPRELGRGLSFLSFYFLGALAVGYYSGYALLVFSELPRKSAWIKESPLMKALNPVVRGAVLLAALGVPAGLVAKNFQTVQLGNGDLLRDFVRDVASLLPQNTAYVLSEDGYQLSLLRAHLAQTSDPRKTVFVNSRQLENPAYHYELRRAYGERWPDIGKREEIGAVLEQDLIQYVVTSLASTSTVVYLHPSFGYFFESLHARPLGQVYRLQTYQRDQVVPPPITEEEKAINSQFWKERSGKLEELTKLQAKHSADATYLAGNYSRALNTWGVFLQRGGHSEDAAPAFNLALTLNSNNIVARVNSAFARSGSSDLASEEVKQFRESFTSWNGILGSGGYLEHPALSFELGDALLNQGLVRQAAIQFTRAVAYDRTSIAARIGLAKALVYGNWIEQGLAEIAKIREDFSSLAASNRIELVSLESIALFQGNEADKAIASLIAARENFPKEQALAASLVSIYRATGQLTNAVNLLDEQLRQSPTNTALRMQKAELLINSDDFSRAHNTLDQILVDQPNLIEALLLQALAFIQQRDFEQALRGVNKVLDRDPDNLPARIYRGIIFMEQKENEKAGDEFDEVLEEQPGNITALRNRAILRLRTDDLSGARKDYEFLQRVMPRSHAVYYGLGEIAYKQGDWENALRHFETYLKYAPREGGQVLEDEKQSVRGRIAELQNKK